MNNAKSPAALWSFGWANYSNNYSAKLILHRVSTVGWRERLTLLALNARSATAGRDAARHLLEVDVVVAVLVERVEKTCSSTDSRWQHNDAWKFPHYTFKLPTAQCIGKSRQLFIDVTRTFCVSVRQDSWMIEDKTYNGMEGISAMIN